MSKDKTPGAESVAYLWGFSHYQPSTAVTPDILPGLLRSLVSDCALEWTTKADIANALNHIADSFADTRAALASPDTAGWRPMLDTPAVQAWGNRRGDIRTVKDLRILLEGVGNDVQVIAQTVGWESGAWNMQAAFTAPEGDRKFAVLTLDHPSLRTLPAAPQPPKEGG